MIDPLAFNAVRIAFAVHARDGGGLRRRSLEEFYCRKNLCTDNGVHADDLAFPLVEGPSLFRMLSGMPIFPMSCRSAAYSSCSISSSGRRMVFPMRELSQRTRSQCPGIAILGLDGLGEA